VGAIELQGFLSTLHL